MNTPWDCIDAFLDGELTAAQEAELRAWLTASREHLREFVRATHLHRSLRAELLAERVLHSEKAFILKREIEGIGGTFDRAALRGVRRQTSTPPRRGSLRPTLALGQLLFARRTTLTFAAIVILLIVLWIWLFPAVQNAPTLSIPEGVQVILERDGQTALAQPGSKLLPADLLQVSGSNGAVVGYAGEKTWLTLQNTAELKVLAWRKGKHFELLLGKIEAVAARQRPFEPMVLRTPQAEALVLGTKFALSVTTNSTRLEVTEGKVGFTRLSDHKTVQVRAGNYAVASANYELLAQPLTGSILRDYWTNLPGQPHMTFLLSNPNFPDHPNGRDYLHKFEAPSQWAENYGGRIYGYLHPPKTGAYTFWIEAGGVGELWLSKDDKPEDRQQIGFISQDPLVHIQPSAPISLVAGQKYYIEARFKQGSKDRDYLAVSWQGPGRDREVIPREFLSPFIRKEKNQ